MTEAKPCPFCGARAELCPIASDFVRCPDYCTDHIWLRLDRWNQRAGEQRAKREHDEARREIIGFECGALATNRVRRRVAEERWPGSNLYPENEYPSDECVSASEVTGGSDEQI